MKKNKIIRSLVHIVKLSLVLSLVFALAGCEFHDKDVVLSSTLKVMYLEVGQGDSILIQAQGEAMLIDAGEREEGNTVIHYLEQENIKSLKYIICTHPHSDHIGGMAQVIKEYKAQEIFLDKQEYDTDTFNNLINLVEKKHIKTTSPTAGDSYNLGGATFEFLTPLGQNYGDNMNNYSLVIKLTNGKNSFLFTGDLEEEAEKDLLSKGVNLEADVLKVGHHGSLTSSSIEFLREVDPVYAVISVGKENSYGHPSNITLANLEDEDVQVYRTDVMGTVIISSDGKNISVNTEGTYIKQDSKTTDTKTTDTETTGEIKGDSAVDKSVKNTDKNTKNYVYVTEAGSKYHEKNCQYVKKNSKALLIGEAKEEGYKPCSVCKPQE